MFLFFWIVGMATSLVNAAMLMQAEARRDTLTAGIIFFLSFPHFRHLYPWVPSITLETGSEEEERAAASMSRRRHFQKTKMAPVATFAGITP